MACPLSAKSGRQELKVRDEFMKHFSCIFLFPARSLVPVIFLCTLIAACDWSPYKSAEIQPGEPDYPVANPHPAHVLTINATIPPTLSVSISAIYEASQTAGGTMQSGTACQREVGLAVTAPFMLTQTVKLVGQNDTFVASVPIDGYLPGRCDWNFTGLSYFSAGVGFPSNIILTPLALYRGDGSVALSASIWCMHSPVRMKAKVEICAPLKNLISDMPDMISPSVVSSASASDLEQRELPLIGPSSTTMQITFHDLDKLTHR
jgi:hypothetical protein